MDGACCNFLNRIALLASVPRLSKTHSWLILSKYRLALRRCRCDSNSGLGTLLSLIDIARLSGTSGLTSRLKNLSARLMPFLAAMIVLLTLLLLLPHYAIAL